MTWRGPRTARDPLLTTKSWRQIRQHWIRLRLPCARCGKPIDYDGPRYWILQGRKRKNPSYLVVGHIVSRYEARLLGWGEAQVNSIANTQPEHDGCSNRSGAQLGQRVQRVRQAARVRQLDESRRW